MGLTFQKISKKYGAVVAIKHAEMKIDNGEVRAILGGNGSGKSTLAKVLGGLISKDTGEIIFQKAVDVLDGDTPETLQRRIMEQAEWKLLPKAINKIANEHVN